MKNYWSFVLLWIFMTAYNGFAQNDSVFFSAKGGFYEDSFVLRLFNYYPQNHIRFTINGNRPTADSKLYEDSLVLNENLYSKSDIYTIINCPETEYYLSDSVLHCIVIRAAVFDENDSCVSSVKTNSYFIRALGCDTHGLPAVSLCADSLDLFSHNIGIFVPGVWQSSNMPLWTGNYFGRGREWERRCNVEFYESDNRGINQEAGLRAHGGASRRFQQKGMKLYAREEYGKKRFKHRFFDDIPIDRVKRLTLRPFRSSNWLQTGLNDALCQRIARNLNIDVQGTRCTVVFLNGEYWGIYYLGESTDSHYLEDHYDVDSDSCNIIKNWNILDEGDDSGWWQLYDWVSAVDLLEQENYESLCTQIDIDNFIDYMIFELFSANVDWPDNNVRCWQAEGRKWRWIFYDGDGCWFRDWDTFANATDTLNSAGVSIAHATLFFRKLIANDDFRTQFIGRLAEMVSTNLTYDNTQPYLSILVAAMEDEVPNQSQRFGFPVGMPRWESDLECIDAFLRNRPEQMMEQLASFFNGVTKIEPLAFDLYPNPSTGQIHIYLPDEGEYSKELCIYDLMGRCMYHQSLHLSQGGTIISLNPDLAVGVYVLKIGHSTCKIIRQ